MKNLADDYKEYPDPRDGIYEDLKVINDATTLDDEWVWLIIDVLLVLPYKISRRVLKNVTFCFASSSHYFTVNWETIIEKKDTRTEIKLREPNWWAGVYDLGNNRLRIRDQEHIILLMSEEINTEEQIERAKTTIAHEIAHYVLGHDRGPKDDYTINREREADKLIQKWGFKPAYTEEMYKQYDQKAEFIKKQREKSKRDTNRRKNPRETEG